LLRDHTTALSPSYTTVDGYGEQVPFDLLQYGVEEADACLSTWSMTLLSLNPPFRFGGVWWWSAGFGCRGSWRATRRDGMPGPVG
jgi:hypothetical protein